MSGRRGANNNDEGGHTNMIRLVAQMREENESIQAQMREQSNQMREQSAALTAALTALGRGPATPATATDPRQSTADRLSLSIANATANGGIPGYAGERTLTPEEEDL